MSYGPIEVFTKGPYKGQTWEKVLDIDPEYLMIEMMDRGLVITNYQASLIQKKFHKSVNKKYICTSTPSGDEVEYLGRIEEDFDVMIARFELEKGYGIDGYPLPGYKRT